MKAYHEPRTFAFFGVDIFKGQTFLLSIVSMKLPSLFFSFVRFHLSNSVIYGLKTLSTFKIHVFH